MLSSSELYPHNPDFLKEDTLSVVFNHKEEIGGIIKEIPLVKLGNLVKEMAVAPEILKIDFDHPFGYYKIPVLTVDFRSKVVSPVSVQYVPDSHEVFRDSEASGKYDPRNKTVCLRESEFNLRGRLMGWIGLGRVTGEIIEDTAEHEIRHGTLDHFLEGPFGGGIINIDEGYAWASKFQPYTEGRSASLMKMIRYDAYRGNYLDPQKIGDYCGLFQAAQVAGVDDLVLLKYMEKNNWWAEQPWGWDLDFDRVKRHVLHFIGTEGLDGLLKAENVRKRKTMLDFQYGVWQNVSRFLEKNHISPDIDWQKALEEERQVQEEWAKINKES